MKVCFVGAYPPDPGVVSQQACWAAHGLAERGHQVTVVTAAATGEAHLDERDAPGREPEFPGSGGFVRVIRAVPAPRAGEPGRDGEPGQDGAALARLAGQVAGDPGCEAVVAFAGGPYAAAGYRAAQRAGLPLLIWPPDAGCPPPAGFQIDPTGPGHLAARQFPGYAQFVDGWDRRIRSLAGVDPAAGLPDMFVESRVAAVARARQGDRWLQFGITVAPERWTPLYAAVLNAAGEALRTGLADEFFYMHKPPGMRLRFQETAAGAGELGRYLDGRLSGWQGDGLITSWRPGIYEPEAYLFGGPVSMHSVHRVFTADSLAWLGYHSQPATEPPGPAWAMSLLLVRALLDALHIVGWEDLDVWDRVQRQAGRRLTPTAAARPELAQLSELLKPAWSDAAALAGRLSAPAQRLADAHRDTVIDEGRRWLSGYFRSGTASAGPREIAAFMIIFHWNRARFSIPRQALLTQALLTRRIGADQ